MNYAWIVGGIKSGHEGKGRVVDWLCAEHAVPLVVRFGGSTRESHNVVTPQGREHSFCFFGAGTFAGAQTYLAEGVRVEPFAVLEESAELSALGEEEPLKSLLFDPNCSIITPFHREYYLGRHQNKLVAPDKDVSYGLNYPDPVFKLTHLSSKGYIQKYLQHFSKWHYENMPSDFRIHLSNSQMDDLTEFYYQFSHNVQRMEDWYDFRNRQESIVFEGHSGANADRGNGIHGAYDIDHVSFKPAVSLIKDGQAPPYEVIRIGVMRAPYDVYYGPEEVRFSTHSLDMDDLLSNVQRKDVLSNGDIRRFGYLDLNVAELGRQIILPNFLFLTHMDHFDLCRSSVIARGGSVSRLTSFSELCPTPDQLVQLIADALHTPVLATSHGPTRSDTTIL